MAYFKTQRKVVKKAGNVKMCILNKLEIYIIYMLCTFIYTHTRLWCLNRFICSELLLTVVLTILDFSMQNCLPKGRSSLFSNTAVVGVKQEWGKHVWNSTLSSHTILWHSPSWSQCNTAALCLQQLLERGVRLRDIVLENFLLVIIGLVHG